MAGTGTTPVPDTRLNVTLILKFARKSASMRRSWIERIRERIGLRQYDMTAHAAEEMAEDGLNIVDVEHAVINGSNCANSEGRPQGQ